LCDRKLGIGADGLIKISNDELLDFNVEYYNSDGTQSFCGNGARCSVAFAKTLGCLDEHTRFNAIDGAHEARISSDGLVHLEMLDVKDFEKINRSPLVRDCIIDTGSPHYVRFGVPAKGLDIVSFGREIRYSERFKEEGINVNVFIQMNDDNISVETYERGVEDETLSCGTGVTACALAFMDMYQIYDDVAVSTKGGMLSVKGKKKGEGFEDIWLIGPAKKVFDGSIEI
jgi:diaminopimelate epimerase